MGLIRYSFKMPTPVTPQDTIDLVIRRTGLSLSSETGPALKEGSIVYLWSDELRVSASVEIHADECIVWWENGATNLYFGSQVFGTLMDLGGEHQGKAELTSAPARKWSELSRWQQFREMKGRRMVTYLLLPPMWIVTLPFGLIALGLEHVRSQSSR